MQKIGGPEYTHDIHYAKHSNPRGCLLRDHMGALFFQLEVQSYLLSTAVEKPGLHEVGGDQARMLKKFICTPLSGSSVKIAFVLRASAI